MTITLELSAPWHWLPLIDWYIGKNDDNEYNSMEIAIVRGLFSIQLYITNFSPIVQGNNLREVIYRLVDKDENKLDRLVALATGDNPIPESVFEERIKSIRDS